MKMETQRERHCLSGILLMIIAITIAMFTNTRMVYAETETGNGYHYQKTTGEPLVTELDDYNNIWQIYASTEDDKYIATITYGGEYAGTRYDGQFNLFSSYKEVFEQYNVVQVEVGEGLTYYNIAIMPTNLQYEYIYLPSTMTRLSASFFSKQTNLKEITIPASVIAFDPDSYGHSVFYMDKSLKSVTFEEGSQLTSLGKNVTRFLSGCDSLKEFTIPKSVETLSSQCFLDSNTVETIRFEEGSKIESIGKEVFKNCSALKSVELTKGLMTIGDSAFRNCDQIEEITIPDTVTTIDTNAFYDCDGLQKVTISDSVTTIGTYAFYDCGGLQEIIIPNSVTSIGKLAFAYCSNVTNIQISNQLETIEEQVFRGCSKVTEIQIPDSVKTIKDEAFRSVDLTEFPYMKNVTTIGVRAFTVNSLRTLEYPKSLTNFTATSLDGGGKAKIKSITFEDGCSLTSLPDGLFSTYRENNTDLKEKREIKLPLSLKELNMNVFCGAGQRTIVEIPHTDKDSLQLSLTEYGNKSTETILTSIKNMYYIVHAYDIYKQLIGNYGVTKDHIILHAERSGWKLACEKDGGYIYTAECSTCGTVSKTLVYDANGLVDEDDFYQPAEKVTNENYDTLGLTKDYIGYYAVSNAGQLYWFADYVNGDGEDATPHPSESVVLCEDIEMNDTSNLASWTVDTTDVINWPSLGSYNVDRSQYNIAYQGTFDGHHKTIRGLYRRNRGEYNQGGLIGYIGKSGALKDLTIEKSFVMGGSVFVGINNGSVTNCTAGAMRTRYCGHGGATFVYWNYGIIDTCVNIAAVDWIDTHRENCYGIVASNYGIVKNCVNKGEINNAGGTYAGDVGGICDWNKGKILNCSNEAPITSTGQASGIVRDNTGYVANCVNTGALTGTYVGGIAAGMGEAEGDDVVIVNPSIGGWDDSAGGSSSDSGSGSTGEEEKLVPVSLSQYGIYYCYNTGAVTASDSCAGGIAADVIGSKGTIYGCYNTGDVEGGSHTGGIAGRVENALIRDCYNYSTNIKTTNVATRFQNNEPCAFAAPIVGCVSSYYGDAVISDCYYVGDSETKAYGYSMDLKGHKVTFTDNEPMMTEDFASGKVAWKLQNGINEDLKDGAQLFVWEQAITINECPKLTLSKTATDKTVMQMTFHYTTGGKDLTEYGYTNYNHAVTENQAPTVTGKNNAIHTFDWYADQEFTTLYDFAKVLTSDADVYAKAYDLYTLEFKLAEGSHATIGVDNKKVTELIIETGEDATFTVTPDTGYILEGVTLDGEKLVPDEDGNYTISGIKANHTVEITTKETEVTFTYKASEHGTVKWVGTETGSAELTETIKAVSGTPKGVLPVADLGWHFVKWVDSKNDIPKYSISGLYPVAANGVFVNETYTAIFEKNVETYTISGTVRDPEGNPVEGVTVSLNGNGDTKTIKSAKDGSYQFEKLEEAEYTISAVRRYENNWKAESKSINVRLEAEDMTEQDLEIMMRRENYGGSNTITEYRVTITERAQTYLNEKGDIVGAGLSYVLSARDKYSKANAIVYVYEATMGYDGKYYKRSDVPVDTLKTISGNYTLKSVQKDYILDVKEEDIIPNRYEITLPSGGDGYTILPEKEGETQTRYGEDYSFTVKNTNDQCFYVYANGTRIEFADGKYTIKNVTKPQEITVKYVEKHTWGEWKETVKPTYEKEGEETRICSVCGVTDKKVVEKLIKEEKPEEPEKDQSTPGTQYTITYVLNKGINHKNNPSTYTSDQSVVLSSPSRKRYEFKGWYTDSKCKKKITSIQKGSKTNYTVYAKWAKITLKKTQKLKLSNTKKKKMVVKYAKVSGTQGYEIVYATNSKFKKGKKIVQTGKRKVTIGKLKKNKVYYVRVRAFKKDSTGKNVYGKYSSTKKIKIKK